MKVIIPMSGMGNRFLKAGFEEPKFLIQVEGRPVINHIIDLYPSDTQFIFICNEKHAEETNILEVLDAVPNEKDIVIIPTHKKGPVGAIAQCYDLIDDDEQIIVNYCDFSMGWDYDEFETYVNRTDCDGAIVCYTGFHPHMLGGDNYAFVKTQDDNLFVEIKEKESYTDDKMSEFASTGTYYFKKGKYIKKYFQDLMGKDMHVNNEYYVSLVYNLLESDNLKTYVYEVPYMLQWGTPLDLKIYNKWSNYYRQIDKIKQQTKLSNTVTILPMAGQGSRFAVEGYEKPKPLIEVNGKPMLQQAIKCLPETEKIIFGCLQEHLQEQNLHKNIVRYGMWKSSIGW